MAATSCWELEAPASEGRLRQRTIDVSDVDLHARHGTARVYDVLDAVLPGPSPHLQMST
jgi:hypothetical protein